MNAAKIDEVIGRYAAGGSLLAYATQGLGPEHATARPGPGTWSLAELVTHLVDSDLVGIDRMKRVIAEDEPTLLAYDENAWIARLGAHEMPIDEAVELFAANRRWMTRILRARPEEDFARSGNHTETGRQTLAALVVNYVGHLDHHLRFLYGKRGNLGIFLAPHYSREG